ncbi:restriction endonuclease subunit S [Parapedobacter sp. GCM10030251]|uniref:restriction endonuclease subunit S n=1 Tax=Parapedobacter sp. GCM10030251 TaxID=3273419 RepID=UPI00360A0AF2
MNKPKNIPELRFPQFVNDGEWEEETVGQIYDFKGTNSLSRENLNYEIGKVKNIHYGDIHTKFNTLFDVEKENVPYINGDIPLDKIKKENYCIEGDIILADASEDLNDVGKSIEIVSLNNEKLVSGLHTLLVRQRESKLVIGFGGYLFKSDYVRKQIKREAQGAKVLGVSATRISSVKIPYPKKPQEQQKIASCLSSLDELIAAHSQKLDILKDHKKGLMQNLFPQEGEKVPTYRFPEFEKDGEWEEKSFEKLFEIGNGRDYKHLHEGEVPVYGSGGYMLSVSDYLYDGESVCIGRKGTIDKPMFLIGKFWTVDTLFYTHSFKDCLPKYIYYVFQNTDWLKHNEAGGVPSLSKTNIYNIKTLIPKPREQQKIASCLSSLDAVITAQTEKIEQLKMHKKGLMQGLFPKTIN